MSSIQKKYKFGFIGLGRMAEVILQVLLSVKLAKPQEVIVSRRSRTALAKIKKKYKVKTTTRNSEVASHSSILWLGLKPPQAPQVLKEIGIVLNPSTTVLSMMTGISLKAMSKALGKKVTIIRLMPNTPALLGAGVTGVYYPPKTSPRIKKLVNEIFTHLGAVETFTQEAALDAVTGLSGSGPAFVYAFAEGLLMGGIKSKLGKNQAKKLVFQTLKGATEMLEKSGREPARLIEQVVSKGGTTEAGLKILKKNKTIESVSRAVIAATRRAQKIRKDFE